MELGTGKMLGPCTPSDEPPVSFWELFGIKLLVHVIISCQKLVELLVLPTCIQMLWHRMTHRKSRRDGTDVAARAPLEPAS